MVNPKYPEITTLSLKWTLGLEISLYLFFKKKKKFYITANFKEIIYFTRRNFFSIFFSSIT